MTRIHDISVPLRSGGLVYPGNPTIEIELQQAIAKGAGANVSFVRLGSHSGTHADASKHFFDNGQTVDRIPLDRFMGPALVVRFPDELASIGARDLEQARIGDNKRILLHTKNSALLSEKEFHQDYTFLAPDGAQFLVDRGVELVGIDYLSIEQFHSGHHKTHRTLLDRSVVILEGLDFSGVQPGVYDLVCLPLRIEGCDGAPARAILIERT